MQLLSSSLNMLSERILENHLSNQTVQQKRGKVIAIIGAGVSNAADNLPMGDELGALLENEICGTNLSIKSKLEEEIRRLSELHDIADRKNFRTIAFSITKIDRRKAIDIVKANLQSDLNEDYSYEQIAYLFKNNFFDAVINFNFDEIFDNILISKFPDFNFLEITSDDTCPHSLKSIQLKNGKYSQPIYVKPHGTLSKENTLRFAREDNHRFQPKTMNIMKELFSDIPVTIVTFGFRLKFKEFAQLMAGSLKKDSRIYLVDKNENIIDSSLEKFYFGDFIQISESIPLHKAMFELRESTKANLFKTA